MKKEENRFAPMMNIKFTILSCFSIFNLMWGEVAYHIMSDRVKHYSRCVKQSPRSAIL